MKQVYIEFAMRVMHWREKADIFCGFTLLPSGFGCTESLKLLGIGSAKVAITQNLREHV